MLRNDENNRLMDIFKKAGHKGPAACFACIALLAAAGFILPHTGILSNSIISVTLLVSAIAFIIPALIFAFIGGRKSVSLVKVPEKGTFKLVFSGSFLLVTAALLIKCIICRTVDEPSSQVGTLLISNSYFGALFCYTVLPAVLEELLFRGIAFSLCEKSSAGLGAIVITSLFFAMSHLSGSDFMLYFVAGVILGTIVYITRSVFVTMIVHLTNNIFSFYLENSLFRISAESKSGILAIFLLSGILLLCLFWFLTDIEAICRMRFACSSKSTREDENIENEQRIRLLPDNCGLKEAVLRIVLSPFMWAGIILFAIYIFIN